MSAYEPNKNILVLKLDYDNQAEIIALDIENVVLIADTINRVEGGTDVSEVRPVAFPGFRVPFFQSVLRLGMCGVVSYQRLLCYDIHIGLFLNYVVKLRILF
jgi:hypothetical protein